MTDSDKLELILEHAQEYYKYDRQYEFIKDGFISYELFDMPNGKAVYFADMFVSKKARGTHVFAEIIEFSKSLEAKHNLKAAYCRVEKDNIYLSTILKLYASIGLTKYKEDNEALYYRVIR
jgi:hypothetical protein